MSRTVGYCALMVTATIVVVLAIGAPTVLGDTNNSFLKGFVNHELLAVLGVILAITLASAGQIHLTLNSIEERLGLPGATFHRTRAGVRSSAYWLIGLFLMAVLLVVLKPLLARHDWSETLFNGAALVVLLWTALILISLTELIFAIKPPPKGD